MSLVTWGQSLHNNHHANPTLYSFASNKEEFDPATIFIPLIKK
jgi:fatty-acid desaturase